MSLRFRLIGLVAAMLIVSLAFGGVIAGFNASRSVRTEMRSALLVGRQTVENAIDGLQSSRDPERDLERLLASFRGNRHLRITLSGDAQAVTDPATDKTPFGQVPDWFVRFIDVAPAVDQVPVVIAGRSFGTVKIETDPHNEILEVWNSFSDSLLMLALFSALIILLMYLFVGRALKPLQRLAAALVQVGHGAYGMRLDEPLTPELLPLRDSFNDMTARLAAMDADNRRLNDQLLTLQEQERADLARDLHDEVSPFLFAINIDIANVTRLLKAGHAAEAPRHIQLVVESVSHLQRQVRNMLGRLRPIGLAEFGLTAAVGNMVDFWRKRHPAIDYRVQIAADCESLGELTDITVYRVVQECLSNAMRHGEPTSIVISVQHGDYETADHVVVTVTDNGRGMDEPYSLGFGLLGMRERVKAMGGSLVIADGASSGLSVRATLPCPERQEAMPISLGRAMR